MRLEEENDIYWFDGGVDRARRLLSGAQDDLDSLPPGPISNLFLWSSTPEGTDFWANANTEFYNYRTLSDEVRKRLEIMIVEWEIFK
jgi:hypothetical protein